MSILINTIMQIFHYFKEIQQDDSYSITICNPTQFFYITYVVMFNLFFRLSKMLQYWQFLSGYTVTSAVKVSHFTTISWRRIFWLPNFRSHPSCSYEIKLFNQLQIPIDNFHYIFKWRETFHMQSNLKLLRI